MVYVLFFNELIGFPQYYNNDIECKREEARERERERAKANVQINEQQRNRKRMENSLPTKTLSTENL